MRIYLIRHGETDYNASGRLQGWLDVPLNNVGREQAQKLAQRLAEKPIGVVYASTLQRAADTGRAIAEARAIPLKLDARLREYNMGDWQGRTGDEISATSPVWKSDGPNISIPGGESAHEMHVRVVAFFDMLKTSHAEDRDRRVAVVTHGGTLGAILASMLGLPVQRRQPFSFGNVSISEVEWEAWRWRMRTLNDQQHLAE